MLCVISCNNARRLTCVFNRPSDCSVWVSMWLKALVNVSSSLIPGACARTL